MSPSNPSLWLQRIASGSLFTAAAVSLVSFVMKDSVDACGRSCGNLWGSEWSLILGAPVILFGTLVYAMAAMSRVNFQARSSLAAVTIAAALWFTFVQAFVLHQFCLICCAIHAVASIGALATLRQSGTFDRWNIAGAVATITVLASMAPWASLHTVAKSDELIVFTSDELRLLNGQHQMPIADVPRLGDPHAGKSMVVMMNYACKHCVHLMKHLREVMTELPESALAVYFVPVATTPKGADALAIMLSLWHSDQALHDEISRDLVDGKLAFEADAIRKVLTQRSFTKALEPATLAKAEAQVQANGRLLKAAEHDLALKGLPQLWFPDSAIAGRADSKAYYFDTLEKHLALRRQVEPRMIIEQTEIALGVMQINAKHRQELRLSNPGDGELEITGAELPEEWKIATAMPLRVPAHGTSKLEVDVVSPADTGPWTASVNIRSNVTADKGTVKFSGKAESTVARVRAPVRVTPLRVVLPPKPSNQEQTYSISVTPDDPKTALHPTVELPTSLRDAGVTVTTTPPDERNAVEVVLHLPAGFDAATHAGCRISLKTGLAAIPEFQLPLELIGQRPRPTFAQRDIH